MYKKTWVKILPPDTTRSFNNYANFEKIGDPHLMPMCCRIIKMTRAPNGRYVISPSPPPPPPPFFNRKPYFRTFYPRSSTEEERKHSILFTRPGFVFH